MPLNEFCSERVNALKGTGFSPEHELKGTGFSPYIAPAKESGLWPPRECILGEPALIAADQLYIELWVSLASLLRSYTAAHGLNGNRQATVELGEDRILVRHDTQWLDLVRTGAAIHWQKAGGQTGTLEMTEAGQLRGESGEEEMDITAETWARELMQ
jgi:hypothetical protein